MAKKILLVDDAAFMRKMIKDTLSKNGYTELFEAVDGADAVEKFGEIGQQRQCGHVLCHGTGEHGHGRGAFRRQGLHR